MTVLNFTIIKWNEGNGKRGAPPDERDREMILSMKWNYQLMLFDDWKAFGDAWRIALPLQVSNSLVASLPMARRLQSKWLFRSVLILQQICTFLVMRVNFRISKMCQFHLWMIISSCRVWVVTLTIRDIPHASSFFEHTQAEMKKHKANGKICADV